MTQTIKPIETRYGGCRFRSRLEARWAVYFDTLEVKWLYEPQGYTIGGRAYLPDFWLPRLRTWVEVKGRLTQDNLALLASSVKPGGLPGNYGDPTDQRTAEILLLGELPKGPDPHFHTVVGSTRIGRSIEHESHEQRFAFVLNCKAGWIEMGRPISIDRYPYEPPPTGDPLAARIAADRDAADEEYFKSLLTPSPAGHILAPRRYYGRAADAAASARFEHGESGGF